MVVDETRRYMTKISRVAQMYTNFTLREFGFNASEYAALRQIRKHPGLSQNQLGELLSVDKAAVARLTASLERKGYILREKDEKDRRLKLLYANENSLRAKEVVTSCEATFYQWLLADLQQTDKEVFLRVLESLYHKSKTERKAGFINLLKWEEKNHVSSEN